MLIYEDDISRLEDGETEYLVNIIENKNKIGSFLIAIRKDPIFNKAIILESVEIIEDKRGQGYGSLIINEINKRIELLKTRNTTFFLLECSPYGKNGLNKEQLMNFYKKYLGVEPLPNGMMVKKYKECDMNTILSSYF